MYTYQWGNNAPYQSSLAATSPVGSLFATRNNFGLPQSSSQMPSMQWGSRAGTNSDSGGFFGIHPNGGNGTLFGGNGGWGGMSYGQWGKLGVQALGTLMDSYSGYKNYKLNKKAFAHQQAMDTQNMRNAVQDYNRRLEERYTTAYAGRGDMTEDEAKQKAKEYREKEGLTSI